VEYLRTEVEAGKNGVEYRFCCSIGHHTSVVSRWKWLMEWSSTKSKQRNNTPERTSTEISAKSGSRV